MISAMHWFSANAGVTEKSINGTLLEVDLRKNVTPAADHHDDGWGESDLNRELFQGYSPALLTFASVCCVVYMMVGVPGNLITIIALFRCKKVSVYLVFCSINLKITFFFKLNTFGKLDKSSIY